MTKLEGYKQAAIRDGDSPEMVKLQFETAILRGLEPVDAYEQIPAGEEEAFIAFQLERKRSVDARLALGDVSLKARMRANVAKLKQNRN